MRKLKLSKPKKINKSLLKKKIDILFSKKIRSLGYCQADGKVGTRCGGVLQWAHIITRSNLRLRWQEENSLCLCYSHHNYFHREPLEFVEFLYHYYPEKIGYVKEHRNELPEHNFEYFYQKLQNQL